LWSLSHDEQHTFAPNFTPAAQRLRDDVFGTAIELHKSFIDASAKKLRQNLGAYFYALNGGRIPADKLALLPHLWSSAFLLTPVVSTTFASVGRMLKSLPAESIGWLLIDEAGQAAPQAAIGAIYRSRRVVSVGDPLQIEPVVTLPGSLADGIARHLGVDPDLWVGPAASVQSVSDAANPYGTTIPRDLGEIRIGVPLLVHRRCENPMFRISNALAYAGLMVHATPAKPSELTNLLGAQVRWFDITGSSEEKWCPEEGEQVATLIRKACAASKGDPDIFVITPFRIVAERMRRRMRQDAAVLKQCGIDDPDAWIAESIGTVHTFQGKEARGVILLLGAPDPAHGGARSWATSNVNLLNVAVSRAKQNFYVVGNRSLWANLGHMKLIARHMS
jgi:superfamily I DNA and/or RNA helicase